MPEDIHVKLVRKYLKYKIACDDVTWRGSHEARDRVADLIRRTVRLGEANSALIIGPRGSGKSTLISSVLSELEEDTSLCDDAIIVRLNGLIHSDDKLAIQAITAQMQLENAVGDRVFGSFAESLSYLLSCLDGADKRSRSIILILEEFHQLCHAGLGQTLLYNLADLTHTAKAPLCVLGVTSRLDVMELLEKRVKSRFSHNHIFVFPHEGKKETPLEYYTKLFVQLLSLPQFNASRKKKTDKHALPRTVVEKYGLDLRQFDILDKDFVSEWNEHIKAMVERTEVVDAIEKFCYYSVNEQIFRDMLLQLVSTSVWDHSCVVSHIDNAVAPEQRARHLQSLSVLELSLLVAMLHGTELTDGQPVNFEMVSHRYTKFVNTNASSQATPRAILLKAFEHLQTLELISPISRTDGSSVSRVQREYQLYSLSVSRAELAEAIGGYKALPTEILHWFNNNLA